MFAMLIRWRCVELLVSDCRGIRRTDSVWTYQQILFSAEFFSIVAVKAEWPNDRESHVLESCTIGYYEFCTMGWYESDALDRCTMNLVL